MLEASQQGVAMDEKGEAKRKDDEGANGLNENGKTLSGYGAVEDLDAESSQIMQRKESRTSICNIPLLAINIVFLKVPRNYQRLQMSYVCKEWRTVFLDNFRNFPTELPWLLMPSSTQPLFHCTEDYVTQILPLPRQIKERARFCGSIEKGWVVLDMIGKYLLYNLTNKETLCMPNTMICQGVEMQLVKVEAAVISGWPGPDAACVVAAIVHVTDTRQSSSSIAYWQYGTEQWVHSISPECRGRDVPILDTLYHSRRRCFLVLTGDLNIHVLTPIFQGDGEMIRMDHHEVQVDCYWIHRRQMESGCLSRYQYLAEYKNGIFRIVKYLGRAGGHTRLMIYKLEEEEEEEEEEEDDDDDEQDEEEEKKDQIQCGKIHASWCRRPCRLLGTVAFAGKGCSRILETDGAFSDHILFLDDRCIPDPQRPGFFVCTDSGMYSVQQSSVKPWPPAGGEQVHATSDKCPPSWWLH